MQEFCEFRDILKRVELWYCHYDTFNFMEDLMKQYVRIAFIAMVITGIGMSSGFGQRCFCGDGVLRNKEHAGYWIAAAARAGNDEAERLLPELAGQHVYSAYQKLKSFAREEKAWAQCALANIYIRRVEHVERNEEKAVRLLRAAAAQGFEPAIECLDSFKGVAHRELERRADALLRVIPSGAGAGEGVFSVISTVVTGLVDAAMVRRIVKLGCPVAMKRAGDAWLALKNEGEAIFWFEHAARKGNKEAEVSLYSLALAGWPSARPYVESKANAGDYRAQAALGRALVEYAGDILRGVELLQLAAAQGDAAAYLELARLYAAGRPGLTPDVERAERYFELYAQWSSEQATALLECARIVRDIATGTGEYAGLSDVLLVQWRSIAERWGGGGVAVAEGADAVVGPDDDSSEGE